MSRVKLISPAGTQASLGIYGEGVDFDSISQRLGKQPSHSHRKGDPGLTSTPYPDDLWLLESPHLATESLDVHLNWLRQTFSPHYDFLRTLMVKHGVRSYCGISVDGDSCRFVIPPEALRIFVELGINMSLGFVFMGYSDLEPQLPVAAVHEPRERTRGTEVSLRISGPVLDFDKISALLGTEPSEVHRAGSLDPSGRLEGSDLWSVVAPVPRTEEFDAHLRWLGKVLLAGSAFLRSLSDKAAVVVQCDLFTEKDITDVAISPGGLGALVDMKIPVDFRAHLI